MQPARAAGRLMAAALRRSPVAFGTAFGTGYGAGFATATGVMFLDDDVQRLEILERLERHVVVEEHDTGRGGEAGAKAGAEGGAKGHGTAPQGGRHQPCGGPGQLHGPRLRRDHGLASNGSLSHVP